MDEEMPRTPAVFPEKTRWNLGEPEGAFDPERGNYASVNDHIEVVEKLVRDEEALGWMKVLSDECARQQWSWSPRRSGWSTMACTACM